MLSSEQKEALADVIDSPPTARKDSHMGFQPVGKAYSGSRLLPHRYAVVDEAFPAWRQAHKALWQVARFIAREYSFPTGEPRAWKGHDRRGRWTVAQGLIVGYDRSIGTTFLHPERQRRMV